VEYFPFATNIPTSTDVTAEYEAVLQEFLTPGKFQSIDDVWFAIERLHRHVPWIIEEIREYDPEVMECKDWGHVCPVFFVQSGATETKKGRMEGRTIPRDVMLKVVRRDNHICQLCHQYVPDDEIEFDHIIPRSKGGPTSVENVRLLCRSCNRKKSDSLKELLWERPDHRET
jgi:hypothetical protein